MTSRFEFQLRRWASALLASLLQILAAPSSGYELAPLESHLRIQRLRRFEEQRRLARYLEPRV